MQKSYIRWSAIAVWETPRCALNKRHCLPWVSQLARAVHPWRRAQNIPWESQLQILKCTQTKWLPVKLNRAGQTSTKDYKVQVLNTNNVQGTNVNKTTCSGVQYTVDECYFTEWMVHNGMELLHNADGYWTRKQSEVKQTDQQQIGPQVK